MLQLLMVSHSVDIVIEVLIGTQTMIGVHMTKNSHSANVDWNLKIFPVRMYIVYKNVTWCLSGNSEMMHCGILFNVPNPRQRWV